MFKLVFRVLLCGCLLHPFSSPAQSLPDPDPERKRHAERIEALREQLEATREVRLPAGQVAPLPRLPRDEAPCFVLQHIRIEGAWPGLPDLSPTLAGPDQDDPPQARCLGAQGIALLAARLQNALIAKGFVTTRVEAPPQDLAQGSLALHILPGRVGQIRYTDPPGPAAALISSVPSAPGEVLNLRDIEQALENFSRVPSAETGIQIAPGEHEGSSDIVLSHSAGRPLRGALAVDDSGTKTTGKYQATATLFYDTPFGLNDLFYLSLQHELGGKDPGERGSMGHVLHYSLPLGYWQLGFTDTASRSRQTVAGAEQSYLYRGRSSTQEVSIGRVLRRDGSGKTSATLKAFSRRSQNFIDDTEVEVQRRRTGGWEAALSHLQYVDVSSLDGQLGWRRGTGAFGAESAPEEAFGEGVSRMQVLTLGLGVQGPVQFSGADLPFEVFYSGQLRGQINHTPLTPQDRFCIGGRYTVRGFDGLQSLCGERGWVWRSEYIFARSGSAVQGYFALDQGGVSGPSSGHLPGKVLVGAALGLRTTISDIQAEFFIGTPLAKPRGFEAARSAAGFSLHTRF